eukprot:2047635-Rhodomonas_salina.1
MHDEKGQRLGLATTSAINEPDWELLKKTPLLTEHELEHISESVKEKWHTLMQVLQQTRVQVHLLQRKLNAKGSPAHA